MSEWRVKKYGTGYTVMEAEKRICYVYASFEDRTDEQAKAIAEGIVHSHNHGPMTVQDEDLKRAVFFANRALDVPWSDPDDDLRTVSRQFLRLLERVQP